MIKKITDLPPTTPIETPKVLKKAISANSALANINGTANIIYLPLQQLNMI